MNARTALYLALCAMHCLLVYMPLAEPIAPLAAGSVYLPLMGMEGLGIPVFENAEPGGWQAINVLGWSIVAVLWLLIWWQVSGLMAKLGRRCKRGA